MSKLVVQQDSNTEGNQGVDKLGMASIRTKMPPSKSVIHEIFDAWKIP